MLMEDRRAETVSWGPVGGDEVIAVGYCPIGWVIEEVRFVFTAPTVGSSRSTLFATIGAVGEASLAAWSAGASLWRGVGALVFEGHTGFFVRTSTIPGGHFQVRPYVRALSGPLTVFLRLIRESNNPLVLVNVVCGRPLGIGGLIRGALAGGESGSAGT